MRRRSFQPRAKPPPSSARLLPASAPMRPRLCGIWLVPCAHPETPFQKRSPETQALLYASISPLARCISLRSSQQATLSHAAYGLGLAITSGEGIPHHRRLTQYHSVMQLPCSSHPQALVAGIHHDNGD